MNKKSFTSALARIDRMKDAEIDYSDIPALDKSLLKTIRLAADVLAWLKANIRLVINHILRVVMESQRASR